MEETSIQRREKAPSDAMTVAVLGVFLSLSVGLNVLLARKVVSLRVQNGRIEDSGRLRVGSSVPALTGYSVDGKPLGVGFGDLHIPTVIYVFSPQCGWCAKNLENFRALIAQAGAGYRIVGLATTRQDLDDYLHRERLTVPVFASVDSAVVGAYHLGATPTTIVVSPEAKVLRVWTGAYQGVLRHEIESFLGVHLLFCCDADASELQTHP
jgi:peroxiredoxin